MTTTFRLTVASCEKCWSHFLFQTCKLVAVVSEYIILFNLVHWWVNSDENNHQHEN